MTGALTVWTPEHLIGGHPALDLTNTVFDRREPADANELLRSPADLANWFRLVGLADDGQAREIAESADSELLETVHGLREGVHAIFDALASGREPASEPLGVVMSCAATGLQDGALTLHGRQPTIAGRWREPQAISSFLALLSMNAYFTLPTERLRSCPRCGWLFADTSRGGRRRWCSMKTCGNREKISRHRERPDS